MRVQSLGQEDPLEKEVAAHSSIFAWEVPWTEEPGRLHSIGSQRVGHDSVTQQLRTTTADVYQLHTSYMSGIPLGMGNEGVNRKR